jgi:hypothetical protein
MLLDIILFIGLIYLNILINSPVGDSRNIRCTGCGYMRRGSESGINLLARLIPFSCVPDWCPGCGGVTIHSVERA